MSDQNYTDKTCIWAMDEGAYATKCGNYFEFTDGSPKENGFNYCPYCGKKLEEINE